MQETKKTIYVGFRKEGFSAINGYLAVNRLTNRLDINLFKLEKYRSQPENILPNTIQYVQVEANENKFSQNDIVVRLIIDKDFNILESECISNYPMEDVFTEEITKQKISGIYPGAYRGYQKAIHKISEADMVLLIDQALGKVQNISKTLEEENLTKKELENLKTELTEWQYAYEFCLANLSRFGVEQNYNVSSQKMEESKIFQIWYKWWQDYLAEVRNDPALYQSLINCRKTCQSLIGFRPNEDFSTHLIKEAALQKTYPRLSINTCQKVS